jgi:DNA polymerase III subunit epsilon
MTTSGGEPSGAQSRVRYAGILDTETQGTDASRHKCIEVAVALFDVRHAQVVSSFSSLIRAESNDAQHVNKILPEMLVDAGDPDLVWRAVRWVLAKADVVIAHKAEFDRQFVPDLGKPWCCSKTDIQWPGERSDHLVQLALSLGLGVASAHRAMADVDTLARIMARVAERGHSLEEILARAMRPKELFYALVSYENRQVAKDHGFSWDEPRHGKNWYRHMPPEDVAQLPFQVKRVARRVA